MKLQNFKHPLLVAFAFLSMLPTSVFNPQARVFAQVGKEKTSDSGRNPTGEKASGSPEWSHQADSLMGAIRKVSGSKPTTSPSDSLVPSTFTQEGNLTASDAATNDRMGWNVAVSGDTAVFGAYGKSSNSGAVYVFTRSTGGVWTEQAKLTPSTSVSSGYFGYAVAIDGDTIAVGAYGYGGNAGAVYVFVRSAGNWSEEQMLTASDAVGNDNLGRSVAVHQDTIVAGAYNKTVSGRTVQGVAYVFTRSAGVWTQQQRLTHSDQAASDRFGWSVAVSGDTALIGAYGKNSYTGAAYVFTRSGTTWSQQAKLLSSDIASGDRLGYGVSLDGDTALVGAYAKNTSTGAAYVFTRSGTTWSQEAKLAASNGATTEQAALGVSVSGDIAALGANGKNSARGAAYVFTRSAGVWTQKQTLTASDGANSDGFGYSVAVSGETIVSGSFNKTSATGRGYTFAGLTTTAAGARLTGRVLTADGRGLRNAMVILTDSAGNHRVAQTGTFGNFTFSDLPAGDTYVLSVRSRLYQFAPQAMFLSADLDGFTIRALGGRR